MMTVTKAKAEFVRVEFLVEDPPHTYMNTMEYPATDPLTEKEIDALIAAEYEKWKTYIETPAPERTKADVEADMARVEKDMVRASRRQVKLAQELAVLTKTAAVEVTRDG